MNSLLVCPTTHEDMIKPYSANESVSTVTIPSHWIMEKPVSNEVERFSTDSPCLLIDLLNTIEQVLKAGSSKDMSFLCNLLCLTSTGGVQMIGLIGSVLDVSSMGSL